MKDGNSLGTSILAVVDARGFMSFNTFYTDNAGGMANNFGVIGYMQYGFVARYKIL